MPAAPDPLQLPLARAGLPGGPRLARLRRLGLYTVRDLLFHLPRRYDDLRELYPFAALRATAPQEPVSARATVLEVRAEQTFRRRVVRTQASLRDETGDQATAVWFGRRFIERRLHPGDRIVLTGKVQLRGWAVQFQNPEFGPDDPGALHAGRIVPVYRLTAGVTNTSLRRAMRAALDRYASSYREYLPADPAVPSGLLPIGEALEEAHFPSGFDRRDAALKRLAFDELLALQLGMLARDRQRRLDAAEPIEVDDERFRQAVRAVEHVLSERIRARLAGSDDPDRRAEAETFRAQLTRDQRAALAAVRGDLASRRPMRRLLQGDVGSGKTAVAALALAFAADAGRQGVLLAPTDLLARQHAATLEGLLGPLGHGVTLLTGSLGSAERRRVQGELAAPLAQRLDGRTQGLVAVGTHAVLQSDITFADLALAVIDEQHRFGVAQREVLSAKGRSPHVLLMTATPIPRTLGQVFHADMDVSDLRERPAGRRPVRTGVRTSADLVRRGDDPTRGTYPLIVRELARGHRAFVVVPLVEADEADGAQATGETAESLRAVLPEVARALDMANVQIAVDMVHGQMKAAERDARMDAFRRGECNVLVGTTVVEVGVDVPEATVMVVLDADRFGVAQLHQLRGRVGRGEAQSYCVLVSDSEDEVARARLHALETIDDGFELAEVDFRLRQAGDLLGVTQSGLPPLRVASLSRTGDRELSRDARRLAERLLDAEGRLDARLERLAEELAVGWLRPVGAGDALADAGLGDAADA